MTCGTMSVTFHVWRSTPPSANLQKSDYRYIAWPSESLNFTSINFLTSQKIEIVIYNSVDQTKKGPSPIYLIFL